MKKLISFKKWSTGEMIKRDADIAVKASMETSIGFCPWKVIYRVFFRMFDKKTADLTYPLGAVYMLGYMYGVRSERKRQKKVNILVPTQQDYYYKGRSLKRLIGFRFSNRKVG